MEPMNALWRVKVMLVFSRFRKNTIMNNFYALASDITICNVYVNSLSNILSVNFILFIKEIFPFH
jgi:hypothetical protein